MYTGKHFQTFALARELYTRQHVYIHVQLELKKDLFVKDAFKMFYVPILDFVLSKIASTCTYIIQITLFRLFTFLPSNFFFMNNKQVIIINTRSAHGKAHYIYQ